MRTTAADTRSMSSAESADGISAREALDRYVREQCEVVVSADVSLRQDRFLVHDTRVAIRRLRSTLRVFASVFARPETAALDAELSWYAGLLGPLRDGEIQQARLAESLAALPPELILGPVGRHLDQQLGSEHAFHRAELTRELADDRYLALLALLTRWADNPQYPGEVERDLLIRRAKKAARKAERRLADALDTADPPVLHRARKAVKRARYGAELVEPLGARKATARIRRFKSAQTALGTYQDCVVTAALLRRIGAGAGTMRGHNGFTYGLLYAHEIRAGEAAVELVASL